jgi:hypothetical protein
MLLEWLNIIHIYYFLLKINMSILFFETRLSLPIHIVCCYYTILVFSYRKLDPSFPRPNNQELDKNDKTNLLCENEHKITLI